MHDTACNAARAPVLAALAAVLAACSPEPAAPPPAPTVPAAVSQPAPLAAPPSPPQARPTPQAGLVDLPVRFTGSVVTANKANSRAMLSVAGAPPREVKVGEQVAEGITLVDVQGDQVTLQAGEISRRVSIEHRAASTAPATAAAKPPPPQAPPANIDEAFRNALKSQLGGQK